MINYIRVKYVFKHIFYRPVKNDYNRRVDYK